MRVRPIYPAQSMQIHLTSILGHQQGYLSHSVIVSVGVVITGGLIVWIVVNQINKFKYFSWSRIHNDKWMPKQFFLVLLLLAVSGLIVIQFT